MSLQHYIDTIKLVKITTGSYNTSNPTTINSKNGKYRMSFHYSEDAICTHSIKIFKEEKRSKNLTIVMDGGNIIMYGIDENIAIDMIESFSDVLSQSYYCP